MNVKAHLSPQARVFQETRSKGIGDVGGIPSFSEKFPDYGKEVMVTIEMEYTNLFKVTIADNNEVPQVVSATFSREKLMEKIAQATNGFVWLVAEGIQNRARVSLAGKVRVACLEKYLARCPKKK